MIDDETGLKNVSIAVSISESDDMGSLGLSKDHLIDAWTETGRHLLALGCSLHYGGDLRVDGFTKILHEVVARHRSNTQISEGILPVTNYLAWPVHCSMPSGRVSELLGELDEISVVKFLGQDGSEIRSRVDMQSFKEPISDQVWVDSLSNMRRRILGACFSQVVLGGKIAGYKGRMPGVAEEFCVAVESGCPVFVLGGFGGGARDICILLGLIDCRSQSAPSWEGSKFIQSLSVDCLNNGLSVEENFILATTPHIDQAIVLVLSGLKRRLSK